RVPGRTGREADLVELIGRVLEVVDDAHRIAAAAQVNDQIDPVSDEHHVAGGDAAGQTQCVDIRRTAVERANGVVARAAAEQIDIVAETPIERIVAAAAVEGVGAVGAGEG